MFNRCIFIYGVKNFMLPIDICNMFVKLSDNQVHAKHSKHDFYLKSVRLDVCKCFVTFAGVQKWSDNIKSAP